MIANVYCAVVPGYYLVCYNQQRKQRKHIVAVVPGYYLVCYNFRLRTINRSLAVVPGYYLVCYNFTPWIASRVSL